ncbi:hypothetical protein B9479_000736 [Cryptococcus floricola]|uniref:U3 small nucleolar RNA-associated protein 22 n=1 Tax=Cryptococcus floricola TaxID=2591691 RepID=A0A5D3B483_9TREE|nr:hypothetical protein B9479_000736 [Cryptococcus floricola]
MVAQKPLKRKADAGKSTGNKRRQPSPAVSDAGFEDLENGSQLSFDEEAMGDLQDPMIDPQHSSDDEDSEEEEDGSATDQPAASSSKPHTNLYKAPTVAELEQLRHVEDTGGATFSLQLSELLESTLLPTTPHPALKSLLSAVHGKILGLSSLEAVAPIKASKRLGKTKMPIVGPEEFSPLKKGKDIKWTLGWEKPEEIVIGGSWGVVGGYKKGKGEMGGVDLVVVMPSSMFSAKDRLDYRYFHKRSHYLAVIYAQLQALADSEGDLKGAKVGWTTAMGDDRRPVISISAGKEQGLKHKLEIRIHASISSTVFPLSSLSPSKCLVRTSLPTSDEHAALPTPLYNTSILHDTLQKPHLLHLHRLSQILPANSRTVDSFLALWRIWAKRRGIRLERGGSGWLAGLLLGWVVNGGWIGGAGGKREKVKRVAGLGKSLGPWGAIRAAWEFLANTDFDATPVFLHQPGTTNSYPHSDFFPSKHVFTDPTGLVNVFAEWEEGEIDFLRYHARETLAMLEDESGERFGDVFLKEFKLGPGVFDEYIQVDISSVKIDATLDQRSEYPSAPSLAVARFASTVRSALSNRVDLVYLSPLSSTKLALGLLLNSSNATRVLDVGPSPEQAEAGAEFRELWGEKAELRRFKDGSIAESVVWDVSRPEDAALIPTRIIHHVLKRHFSVSEQKINSFSTSQGWLSVIQVPPSARDAVSVKESEKLGFRPTITAYDALYKILKNSDADLPLGLLNIQSASPLMRYSSTFVPHPIDVPRLPSAPACIRYTPHIEVVIQFESSPKWPDDLAAVQKVKLALLEKLARVVQKKLGREATVGIVFDDGASEIEDQAALEVVVPEGVAFKLRVYYEREKGLLERAIEDDQPAFATSLPNPPRRLAVPALAKHIERFHHLPAHHSSLAPLHHRYPNFSSSTRLLKRWFSAHMMMGPELVREEVIELIMAGIYLEPGRGKTPASAVAGFLRAMELLGGWDYKSEPMLVPIHTAFSPSATSASGRVRFPAELKEEAIKTFESLRAKEKDAGHPWVICTEQDVDGLRWTKGLGKGVAARVALLARATLEAAKSGVESGALDVRSLFVTPVEHFDFLIHLNAAHLSRSALAIHPDPSLWEPHLKFRNLSSAGEGSVRVDFDPATMFVRDLQKIYGDGLMVFHDIYGGKVVGGVWNAKQGPRGMKAFLGWNSRPVESGAELVGVNKEGILGEIARLGKGLVEKIEVR